MSLAALQSPHESKLEKEDSRILEEKWAAAREN